MRKIFHFKIDKGGSFFKKRLIFKLVVLFAYKNWAIKYLYKKKIYQVSFQSHFLEDTLGGDGGGAAIVLFNQ